MSVRARLDEEPIPLISDFREDNFGETINTILSWGERNVLIVLFYEIVSAFRMYCPFCLFDTVVWNILLYQLAIGYSQLVVLRMKGLRFFGTLCSPY